MMSGTYKLYLARTMLALFSDKKFAFSSKSTGEDESELDLTAHLTNTCLQVSTTTVYLKPFETRVGQELIRSSQKSDSLKLGTITEEWLESTFETVGKVVAETVTAAVNCGSFGLQLLPNAFEVSVLHLSLIGKEICGFLISILVSTDLRCRSVTVIPTRQRIERDGPTRSDRHAPRVQRFARLLPIWRTSEVRTRQHVQGRLPTSHRTVLRSRFDLRR
jgi:hypothetical protein